MYGIEDFKTFLLAHGATQEDFNARLMPYGVMQPIFDGKVGQNVHIQACLFSDHYKPDLIYLNLYGLDNADSCFSSYPDGRVGVDPSQYTQTEDFLSTDWTILGKLVTAVLEQAGPI